MISDEIMIKKTENNFKDFKNDVTNKIYEFYILETTFKIICYERLLTIEFYEQKPHHYRSNYKDQIDILFSNLTILKDLRVFKDFEKNSWLSILWFPLKTIKHNLMNTSFLIYYSLNNLEQTKIINNFHHFPVIGVLPLRLDEEIWLSKINKNNLRLFDIEYKLNLDKSIVIAI